VVTAIDGAVAEDSTLDRQNIKHPLLWSLFFLLPPVKVGVLSLSLSLTAPIIKGREIYKGEEESLR